MIDFIRQASDKTIPLKYLVRHFSVSASGFYSWSKRFTGYRFLRKEEVTSKILEIFEESKGTYGSPRIYSSLQDEGIVVSPNTVAKYMRELGLDARLRKKYRVLTTDSNHEYPIAPRLFKTEESHLPQGPGELLAGDITYLRLGKNFLYLSVVLDLFNREVVGWSMGKSLETGLVLNSLDMAMRAVGPAAEIIFHSDRGSQYASEAYRKMLKRGNIKASMSRKGNCYDNAYVESWFSGLKKEWIYRNDYSTCLAQHLEKQKTHNYHFVLHFFCRIACPFHAFNAARLL